MSKQQGFPKSKDAKKQGECSGCSPAKLSVTACWSSCMRQRICLLRCNKILCLIHILYSQRHLMKLIKHTYKYLQMHSKHNIRNHLLLILAKRLPSFLNDQDGTDPSEWYDSPCGSSSSFLHIGQPTSSPSLAFSAPLCNNLSIHPQ